MLTQKQNQYYSETYFSTMSNMNTFKILISGLGIFILGVQFLISFTWLSQSASSVSAAVTVIGCSERRAAAVLRDT